MSKRDLDALFRGAAASRAGEPAARVSGRVVCGGFGGFGGVPGHVQDMLAAQGLRAVEVGPDEYEVVPEGPGKGAQRVA